MSEQNQKSTSQKAQNAKTVAKTAMKAASGDVAGAVLEAAKNPEAIKEAGKKGIWLMLLLNPVFHFFVGIIVLITLLIMLIGFAILNPLGLTQQAQTTDFVAYEEAACESLREINDPNLPEVCQKPLKQNMSKEEFAEQLLQYNSEDQFKGLVILMRNLAAQEYAKTAAFVLDFQDRFNETYDLSPPGTNMSLYKIGGKTYLNINDDALGKEYDSIDNSVLLASSPEEWDADKNKNFNGGSILMDASDGFFFSVEQAAEVVAAYQTGMGDTYPVIREPGDHETAVSYFIDFLALLEEASGSFYSATAEVSEKDITINYDIKTIKWTESTKNIPGEFECARTTFWGEDTVSANTDGTCPADPDGLGSYSLRNKQKTVYTPSLNDTSEKKSVDGKIYMFDATFSGFQTHVVDALMITKAKFKNFKTDREYLFNEYQMDELNIDRSKVDNPAKSCGFDAALGSLQNVFEGFMNFLTGGNSDTPTVDHGLDNFFKCMSEKTSELVSEMQTLYDAPFYRWEPIYYYQCNHINYGYETCQHILTETEASQYNSNKSKYNWNNGLTWEAGDTCNAPIDTAHNGVISMVTEGISDFFSWLGDTKVAHWVGDLINKVPIINKIDDFLGWIGNGIKSALISKHSIYTYERMEVYEVESDGLNPIKKQHSPKIDLFEDGHLWYEPQNEDYTVDGMLSEDFSTTETKKFYFTIGGKLEGYKNDILEMNSELIEQMNSNGNGGFADLLKVPIEMSFADSFSSGEILSARCLEGFRCKIYPLGNQISSRVWGRISARCGGCSCKHQCVSYTSGFFGDMFKRAQYLGGDGVDNAAYAKTTFPDEFESYVPPGSRASDHASSPPSEYKNISSSKELAMVLKPGTIVSSNPGSTPYGHIQAINDVGFAKKNSSGEWEFFHAYSGDNIPSDAIPIIVYSDGNVAGCGGTRNHHVVSLDEFLTATCPTGKMCVFTSPKSISAYKGKFSSWADAGSYDFVTGTKNAYDIKTQKCIKTACKTQETEDNK